MVRWVIEQGSKECSKCGKAEIYRWGICRDDYKEENREEAEKQKKMAKEQKKIIAKAKKAEELAKRMKPCRIEKCGGQTAKPESLCRPHEIRARAWQFSASELVAIYDNAKCEICQGEDLLVLDHQHGLECEARHTGTAGCPSCFRGLLCNGCNSALGFMREEVTRFHKAAEYLESRNQRM